MKKKTPEEWLAYEMELLEIMQAEEPVNFYRADRGHTYLLAQFSGLRAMQAFCLSCEAKEEQGLTQPR